MSPFKIDLLMKVCYCDKIEHAIELCIIVLIEGGTSRPANGPRKMN
jgi:hypothetical protein